MRYIILNNKDFFQDKIKLDNFTEVQNETERCDAVFGEITIPLLEELHYLPERRDQILPESWLLTDGGVSFILCKFDKGILHHEDGKPIKRLLGLYDQENFYTEIRSYNCPQSYNQIECYIFCYNKNFGYQNNILPDKISNENQSIITTLCENIQKKIL